MSKHKRVGIMGGTFNPIHLGHLILAETAYEELSLDEVLFIPSGISYLKDQSQMLPPKLRIALVSEAIKDNPHFALSTLEAERAGNSYSYETIEILRENNPETEYIFLVGADSLFGIEVWKHPERIFANVTLAVAIRKGYTPEGLEDQIKLLEEKYDAKIIQLPCRSVDISSTRIRERVRVGKSIRYMVRYQTEQVIRQNGLYLDKQD